MTNRSWDYPFKGPLPPIGVDPPVKCPYPTEHGDVVCKGGVLWGLTYSDMGPPDSRQRMGNCPFCCFHVSSLEDAEGRVVCCQCNKTLEWNPVVTPRHPTHVIITPEQDEEFPP